MFGKPGITLPIPTAPASSGTPTTAASSAFGSTVTEANASIPVESEAQRRNQRLARFAAAASSSTTTTTTTTTTVATLVGALKRPLSGLTDAPTPQKLAKTADEEETKTSEETLTEVSIDAGADDATAAVSAPTSSTPPPQTE